MVDAALVMGSTLPQIAEVLVAVFFPAWTGLGGGADACYRGAMFPRWLSLAILLFSAPAAGAERLAPPRLSDLPPIDPPGVWHTLTQDDATSDSTCIGRPVTPLCAVETVLACRLRGDDELCRIGMGLREAPGYGDKSGTLDEMERYSINDAAIVNRSNMDRYSIVYPFAHLDLEVGDAVFHLRSIYCSRKTCTPPLPTIYQLRKIGHQWAVVTWSAPRSD